MLILEVFLVEPVDLEEPVLDGCVIDNRVYWKQLIAEHYPVDLIIHVHEAEECEEETDNYKEDYQLDDQVEGLIDPNL